MLESSNRVVSLALRQFELGGLAVPQLVSGLKLGRDGAAQGFADWNAVAQLFERAEEALAGPQRMQRLCEEANREALPEGRALMELAPNLVAGSRLINAYAESMFFANIRYPEMKRVGERKLELTLRIPQRAGFRDSRSFFFAMSGVLRGSSTFAGLPPATVQTTVRPFVAHYEIELPVLQHQSLSEADGMLRRALFANWQKQMRGLRGVMLAQQQNEVRALESATFAALSAGVAAALVAQERAAMPAAAAEAIRDTLRCSRVVLRMVMPGSTEGVVLAACGPPRRLLTSIEREVQGTLVVVSADVERDSAAAAALRALVPWLALVLGTPPPPVSPSGPPAIGDSSSDGGRPPEERAHRLRLAAERWSLTPRQAEVLPFLAEGASNANIAANLGISERTVEDHVAAILRHSRAGTRAILISELLTLS